MLVAILPPLLYSAAFFTGLRDLRANLRPISLLAFPLVAATTCGVAVVAHAAGQPLVGSAFVLGAIVSPTDALAATEVAGRLNLPRRIVSIIEGESLFNDGTALVLYKFAVVAAVTGRRSRSGTRRGTWSSTWSAGSPSGSAMGYLVRQVRKRIDDTPTEVAIALLSGYLAYLPAAALGVSGVLAAVTIGVYMGWYTPELTTVQTRLSGNAFWEILVFMVNALLFALIGLQLHEISSRLPITATLIGQSALVVLAIVVIRFVSVPIFTYVPRWMFRRIREKDPYPPWQYPAIIAWVGVRGAVSLAAALALPIDVPGPRPDRVHHVRRHPLLALPGRS